MKWGVGHEPFSRTSDKIPVLDLNRVQRISLDRGINQSIMFKLHGKDTSEKLVFNLNISMKSDTKMRNIGNRYLKKIT